MSRSRNKRCIACGGTFYGNSDSQICPDCFIRKNILWPGLLINWKDRKIMVRVSPEDKLRINAHRGKLGLKYSPRIGCIYPVLRWSDDGKKRSIPLHRFILGVSTGDKVTVKWRFPARINLYKLPPVVPQEIWCTK